jgi:N-acetylmuramoyl-L-alanine amidase
VNPQPYELLSGLQLLELCVWREARGEPVDGKIAVAHVIRNRVLEPSWWNGHKAQDYHAVILHPYQFSSFNESDPNSQKWPADYDPSFEECCLAAEPVFDGVNEDLTNGAQFYHDTSIGWPTAWGQETDYENTFNVGRLKFYKLRPLRPPQDLTIQEDV